MFDKNEIELLDVAYQIFVARTHVFDVLRNDKWKDTGIEHWVQTEFIVALVNRGYNVTTIRKRALNCDIIVKNEIGLDVRIEIETMTYPPYTRDDFIVKGLQHHTAKTPKPDLFLLLGRTNNSELSKLCEYIEQHDYIERHKMLMDDWMVMLVKKKQHQFLG